MPDTSSQQQALNRRRQLAAALQQQSMMPIEQPNMPGANVNVTQGLAKVVQALMANLSNRKIDKEQTALDTTEQAQRLAMAQKLIPHQTGIQQVMADPAGGSQAFEQLPGPQDQERWSGMAQALASTNPQMQQLGQAGLQQQYGQMKEGRDQAADMARLLTQQQGQQALQANSQDFQRELLQAQAGAQQPGGFNLSPGQTRFNAAGQPIASLPPTEKLEPVKPLELDAENVNVDGKPDRVLKDKQGNYYDITTKKLITGRITPYIAPATPRQRGEITPTAEAGLIQSLNKQWEAASKDVQSLYRANSIMQAGLEAAKRGDMNAGSQAILVTFQKFLDPTSVVRESEYARSGAGLAMADRVRGYIDKLQQGGAGVTFDQLQKFAQLGQEINDKLAAEGTSLLSAEKKRISSVADRYNVPPELAIPTYSFTGPQTPTAGQPPAAGTKRGTFNPATGKVEYK